MRHVFIEFFLFLLCAGMSVAESSVWLLSRDGNRVYLAGSVHLLRAKDLPMPAEFEAAFAGADTLVIETDVDGMNSPSMMREYTARIMLKSGETLRTRLNKTAYKLIELECAKLSLPMEQLENIRPQVVVNMLTAFKLMEWGFTESGADLYYFQKAKEASKPLLFLEPLEVHLDALVAAGDDDESQFVLHFLKGVDQAGNELAALVEEWKRGEGTSTEATVNEMKLLFPGMYRTMLADRNNAWLLLIEEYLASPEVELVIAGLAHFYGPDGLLQQLVGRGYTLERFSVSQPN
jgi:uncharacterized protein YbaP (TraB family)